tara:strand:- start:133 stop:1773 length:1641 start_codon:yes stop_codon:yes gene_type:complete
MAIPVDPSAYMYYYNTGGGNNAPSESYYCGGMPIGINPYDNTHLDLYYPSIKGCSAVDTIRLTITAGKHKQISDILVKEFLKNNAAPVPVGQDPIITIFDGDKSPIYKIQQDILGVSITYGTGCSSGGGGSMSNWTLSDGSTTQQIDNAETVLFSDGTFINNVVSATNTVTTDLSATGTPNTSTFLRGDNTWSSPPNTTYSKATNSALGLVKLEDGAVQSTAANAITTTASRTYGLQFNASDQLVVNVPWSNTTYTAGNGLDLSGTTFSTDIRSNSGLTITSTELDLNLSASSITGTLDETDGGTGLTSYTTGDVLYASGSNTLAKLAVGSNTNVLTLAGGVPSWAAPAASGCADVYKTIAGTTGSTVASGCSDTLTIQSPNSSIIADAATADTLKLSARKYESFVITMTDEARPITVGIKYTFRIPYNFTYSWYGGVITTGTPCNAPFKLTVNTPPSGTEAVALTVNVESSSNNGGSWASLFATLPSIDGGEYSSVTGSAQMVLGSSVIQASLSCDTLLRFTVSKITGSPIGLKCTMVGYQSSIV